MISAPSLSEIDDATPRTPAAIYWIATLVAAAAFVVPGVLNLVRAPHIVRDMAHLGYPPYFPTILGTWKVLGALAIAAVVGTSWALRPPARRLAPVPA